jgi:hypothetical protein
MNAMTAPLNDEADSTQLVKSHLGDALSEVETLAMHSESLQTGRLGVAGLGLLNALLPEVEGHPC